MNNSALDPRAQGILALIAAFRPERMTYLVITAIAAAALLGCTGVLLWQSFGPGRSGDLSDADVALLVALFGSSGVVTYSVGRILRMWDQVVDLIRGHTGADL